MQRLPEALIPLALYNQFLTYKLVPSQRKPGKMDKFPYSKRAGRVVDSQDPQFWLTCAQAIAEAESLGQGYGVAFVFTANDPFFFLDLDNCLNESGTDWSPLAHSLMQALPGCAIEVSQSGRGLHIFGTGTCPPHACKNIPYGLELYTEGRFVALTGTGAVGNAATDMSAVLPWLVNTYFEPKGSSDIANWTVEADPEWHGPTDDEDLIRRAMKSAGARAAFGNNATFADLWTRNVEILALAYPDDSRDFDESSADRALAQHLAFWTGKNCERIEGLMRQSALVREKWEREDYLPRTILSAVSSQRDVLVDKQLEPIGGTPVPGHDAPLPSRVTGTTFLSIDNQMKLFAGCVYVRDAHKILIPGGEQLRPDQFRAQFGGFTFMMDAGNERTSRNAWEAFTESQAFRAPRADTTCFRPDLPPGSIVVREGRSAVNVYWPADVPMVEGDASPFLNHVKKLLPNERDQRIILSYMAACVQHKGIKFQWAPAIQGEEGNGKTLLSRCVAEAVGRRYTHWPKASKLSNQFNGWMLNKLFYGVEDIYRPQGMGAVDIIEELKPMITGGDGLEIEGKGVDQISADICGNFMFNMNKKDSIPKTANGRRFAVFFSAQQSARDIERDFPGSYFVDLYNWLKLEGGYAVVTHYLMHYPIDPEFNPAGKCQRAPDTSSTSEAVLRGVGTLEQEVLEAIEQGLPGFAGGWVSSMALDRLLERLNAARRMPHMRRREMMQALGYDYHPSLTEGRVNNIVQPDNGKPRLFVKRDSPLVFIAGAAEVAKKYSEDNC
jgi:hypothetical protein